LEREREREREEERERERGRELERSTWPKAADPERRDTIHPDDTYPYPKTLRREGGIPTWASPSPPPHRPPSILDDVRHGSDITPR
jgi:hypothetical protein